MNTWYIFFTVIRNATVKLVSGEKHKYTKSTIQEITTYVVFFSTLGKCFELKIDFSHQAVASVELMTNFPVYIYVNMPGQTTNEDSKSKVEVKMKQRLFIDVSK